MPPSYYTYIRTSTQPQIAGYNIWYFNRSRVVNIMSAVEQNIVETPLRHKDSKGICLVAHNTFCSRSVPTYIKTVCFLVKRV